MGDCRRWGSFGVVLLADGFELSVGGVADEFTLNAFEPAFCWWEGDFKERVLGAAPAFVAYLEGVEDGAGEDHNFSLSFLSSYFSSSCFLTAQWSLLISHSSRRSIRKRTSR